MAHKKEQVLQETEEIPILKGCVKAYGGEKVSAGSILIRQRGYPFKRNQC